MGAGAGGEEGESEGLLTTPAAKVATGGAGAGAGAGAEEALVVGDDGGVLEAVSDTDGPVMVIDDCGGVVTFDYHQTWYE